MQRIMMFIDGSNVKKSALFYDIKVDYLKLKNELSEGKNLIRAYFFDSVPVPTPGYKQSFLDALRHNEITVVTKALKTRVINCNTCPLGLILIKHNGEAPNLVETKNNKLLTCDQEYQKGVDVALVTELLRMARENVYDTAVIVSGDNDYSNAVECVKSMGKRVEIAAFKHSLGNDLKRVADKLTYLDTLLDRIKRSPKSLNKPV